MFPPDDVNAAEKAPAAVDVQHLGRYTLGNKALEKEILALFLVQMPDLFASLRSAQSERDWKMAAHSLKGAARAIGAWHMASLAEEAERIDFGSDGQDACARSVQLLEEAGREVRLFVERFQSE